MRQVWFTSEAEWDLVESKAWYAGKNEKLADRFMRDIANVLDRIAQNPQQFQRKYRNIRTAYLKQFPFGIHFITKDADDVIIGMFHFSSDPRNWDQRI